MLVKMLVGISGRFYTLEPGDEFHFPDDEADRLVSAGYAVPVVELKTERAVREPAPERRGRRAKHVVHTDSDGGAGE